MFINHNILTMSMDFLYKTFVVWFDQIFSFILHFEQNLFIKDELSSFLIFLSLLFFFLILLSQLTSFWYELFEQSFYNIWLLLNILLVFLTEDLMSFFFFFEATLLPIFLSVLNYGSRERKVRASIFIAIYTFFGSLFLFLSFLLFFSKYGSTDFSIFNYFNSTIHFERLIWFILFISFASKVPLFPLHIWLPEAHVEASTIGSVLLAALILKLGTYGILRFMIFPFFNSVYYFYPFFSSICLISVWYTSWTAIRQIDLKKIIAYSSISHMGVVLAGFLTMQSLSNIGGLFQMFSHGLISGALFFCVGTFYQRYKVRSLKYFSGLIVYYPLVSFFFLFFSMANISFPGTSNFIGEFLIFFGMINLSLSLVFLLSCNMVFSGIFMLWTLNRLIYGNLKIQYIHFFKEINFWELFIYSLLTFLVLYTGIYSFSLTKILNLF